MRYEMNDEKWEQALRDFLERHNPEYTPEEINVLLAQLLGEN